VEQKIEEILRDTRFYELLLGFDRQIADAAHAGACRECGSKLHWGSFGRKPRGAPAVLGREHTRHFSLCCPRDGCRTRETPSSLRFLGRKVYLGAMVVLISAMQSGLKPELMKRLRELVGVSRRTVLRWREWWRTVFTMSPFCRAHRGLAPAAKDADLPASLLQSFKGEIERQLISLSRFLARCCASSRPSRRGAGSCRQSDRGSRSAKEANRQVTQHVLRCAHTNQLEGSADTVEKLLTDESLRRQVHGQVVWIDEAGLLSTRDMKRVFDLAASEGCRVVLAGDIKQHSAVARRDALRLLETEARMEFAELKQIRRQIHDDYREAVTAISEGDQRRRDGRTGLDAGIAKLDSMGAVDDVAGFTPQGDIRSETASLSPKDYGGLSHSYVVTLHASQGATFDHVLVALGSESPVAANRQQFFGSVSRGPKCVGARASRWTSASPTEDVRDSAMPTSSVPTTSPATPSNCILRNLRFGSKAAGSGISIAGNLITASRWSKRGPKRRRFSSRTTPRIAMPSPFAIGRRRKKHERRNVENAWGSRTQPICQ